DGRGRFLPVQERDRHARFILRSDFKSYVRRVRLLPTARPKTRISSPLSLPGRGARGEGQEHPTLDGPSPHPQPLSPEGRGGKRLLRVALTVQQVIVPLQAVRLKAELQTPMNGHRLKTYNDRAGLWAGRTVAARFAARF